MVNDRPGQTHELCVSVAKIFLAVIGPAASRVATSGALVGGEKLNFLPGPTAFRAFHPFVNPSDEHLEGDF